MLWHEIAYKTTSYFHTSYQAFDPPYDLWISILKQVVFVETILAIIAWITTTFLDSAFLRNSSRILQAILTILIIFFSASSYSIGSFSIDIIWVSTLRTSPSLGGIPRSGLFEIITISSFLIVILLYTSRYHKNIKK